MYTVRDASFLMNLMVAGFLKKFLNLYIACKVKVSKVFPVTGHGGP
jgi:hypothetical protein